MVLSISYDNLDSPNDSTLKYESYQPYVKKKKNCQTLGFKYGVQWNRLQECFGIHIPGYVSFKILENIGCLLDNFSALQSNLGMRQHVICPVMSGINSHFLCWQL